jgi:hypothetical protein
MGLQIKPLKGYLGTGLKLQLQDGSIVELIGIESETPSTQERIIYKTKKGEFKKTYFYEVKPAFHPLSDLVDYCGNLGFVPIRKFYDLRHVSDFELIAWEKELIKDIENNKEFKLSDFQKLYDWGFDIYGLIPQKLAVNINTINQI